MHLVTTQYGSEVNTLLAGKTVGSEIMVGKVRGTTYVE